MLFSQTKHTDHENLPPDWAHATSEERGYVPLISVSCLVFTSQPEVSSDDLVLPQERIAWLLQWKSTLPAGFSTGRISASPSDTKSRNEVKTPSGICHTPLVQ